jgi:hypothetical protein
MKTKLFYLFIAVFLFSFSGKSQNPVITLIGSGNGGWTDTAETPLLTSDGITYTLVDKVLTTGELKFREGKCWTTGCAPTVTNTFGWGPTDAAFALNGGWPSGTNATPVDAGKNIQCQAGVWTITFNRINGTWSFVPGTPLPVIKLVGAAVSTPGGAVLTTQNGTVFTAKKVTLVPGACKFDIDGTSYGSAVAPGFPTGTADAPAGSITVATTGIDYDVTFDYSTGIYSFAIATFPEIGLIGSATTGTDAGWSADIAKMATTDGVTYTLNGQVLYSVNSSDSSPGKVKFRTYGAWTQDWGGVAFPTGPTVGNNGDIVVTKTGAYNITFNKTTGAYTFSEITLAIVGNGVGVDGWPGNPGNPGPIDVHQLSTVDGINYTKNNLTTFNDGAKFRFNNAWGGDWGGTTFPIGLVKTGDNIPCTAGVYNLTVNRVTGLYTFTAVLGVDKFDAKSFSAYPNPTRDSWNIVSGNDDITSLQVYNVLGKVVYTKFSSAKEVSVNASELSKGVYFAKVATANGQSTLKLIKE